MDADALDGYTIGVTADRRAEEQAELLRRRGAHVLHGPVIRTAPLSDTELLIQRTDALIASPPDVMVLTTGIGLRAWMAVADAQGRTDGLLAALHGTEVVARGPKARGAATTLGVEVTWSSATETSGEIVERLGAAGVRGRRVAVQRDGGDPELAGRLRAMGADVVDIAAYRWTLPEVAPAQKLIDALCSGRLDAITFTSPPAVGNLLTLAGTQAER